MSVSVGNESEANDACPRSGESSLFLLNVPWRGEPLVTRRVFASLEGHHGETGMHHVKSDALYASSGVLRCALEKLAERIIMTCVRTHNRIRIPR